MTRIFINTFYNLLGHLFPVIVGLICIPQIIQLMGQERFGVLSIIWVAVGYFSFFDLGLGRAITKKVIELFKENDQKKIAILFWSSSAIIFTISTLMSILLYIYAQDLVSHFAHVSAEIHHETVVSLRVLSISFPFVVLLSALKGFIEAHEDFKMLNFFQVLMGVYSFVSPILFFKYSPSLISVVIGLAIGRVVFFIVHLAYCKIIFPNIIYVKVQLYAAIDLLKYGGWLTVSNIVGPFMVYFDRFALASILPMSQVVYYSTPQEIISRILLLPNSLVRVLFPSFSKIISRDNDLNNVDILQLKTKTEDVLVFWKSILSLVLVFIPILIGIFLFSEFLFKIWINDDFSKMSAPILKILAVGMFFNSLALVPFTYLQAHGKANWTAVMHLIELPVYAVMFWFLSKNEGIVGAAYAWSIRTLLDFFILMFLARYKMKTVGS